MDKIKIMILGTFHMASKKNLYNFNISDIMSSKIQKEIEELINNIKKFKPTKIAVEYEFKNQDELDIEYTKYYNNITKLKIREIDQIAFRLAKSLKHQKVYAIDWMEKEQLNLLLDLYMNT